MLLVLDNYDSFTYNLVQYLGELGAELRVVRNDQVTLDEIPTMQPQAIVLGPAPGTPADAGVTVPVIQRFGASIPMFGVCLGHQAIGEAYGGDVIRAPRGVMRYHSLVVKHETLPAAIEVTATAIDDRTEIHALRHRAHPVYGVQFHPESIGTAAGKQMLRNFLSLAQVT